MVRADAIRRTSPAVEIEVTRPGALTPEDLARWGALQAADPALDTPFLSPGWALAVERAQEGGRDADPSRGVRVAVLRDGGEARGFFSTRVAGSLAMPAGAPMNDYQGLVAGQDVVVDAKALIRALGVQRLDFTHMLEDQPTFAPYRRGEAVSYRVETPDGYAAYAESRREAGSGVLKDIDKRRRKVEREVGPVRFTAQSRSGAAFDQLIAWKRRAISRHRPDRHLRDALDRAPVARPVRTASDPDFGGALFTLHIGDQAGRRPVQPARPRTLHAWIIAHDEAFERYSPGLILFQEILRWMDETSLQGARPRRRRLPVQTTTRQSRGRWSAHGFVGRPSPAAPDALRRIRRARRRRGPAAGRRIELPGKAMRRLDLLRGLR